ncbi:MAG TPA: alpha/beta hydrolase [bacterium]|nr:alpha/beta hydrolase [bacterium]
MPKASINGVQIYYEEVGSGTPLLFLHEFAGDYRSWEDQLRFFARRYRCITYSARGYPPSDVPSKPEQYSQDHSIADAVGLLDHLKIAKAHLCGLSMGSFTALYTGLRHPGRCLSLTVAGGGSGAGAGRAEFLAGSQARAQALLKGGMPAIAEDMSLGPTRIQLHHKDKLGWETFKRQFLEHSGPGSAYTLLGVQRQRPDLFTLGAELRACTLPALIILGDEDAPGFEGMLHAHRSMPRAGLAVFPKSGHAVNLEEPELFNRTVLDFLTAVEAGDWGPRDPKALAGTH